MIDDEFVIGFCSDDPEGLTPIDIVSDVTGLSINEIRNCYEVVKFPEPYIEPDYDVTL